MDGDGMQDLLVTGGGAVDDEGAYMTFLFLGPVEGVLDPGLAAVRFWAESGKTFGQPAVAGGVDLDGGGTPDIVVTWQYIWSSADEDHTTWLIPGESLTW
jgi:hypothetical protein